jgi:hypothetical protein
VHFDENTLLAAAVFARKASFLGVCLVCGGKLLNVRMGPLAGIETSVLEKQMVFVRLAWRS